MRPALAIILVITGLGIALATARAARRGVPEREERVFRAVNGWPDRWFPVLGVVMQFGTFITTPIAGVAIGVADRTADAIVIALCGTGAWVAAKLAKEVTRRARPAAALATAVRVRGREQGGGGFPSGHAATAASLAITLGAAFGGWWWPPLIALAALTGLGRVYIGAHLPLDVLGGAGLGVAIAAAGVLIATVGLG
jgi:membrane-associated phospholipid phosphatase